MHIIQHLTYLLLGAAIVSPPTWAHDVRPVDQNRTRILEEEDDAQKAEEAMLKLHFALLAESRQGGLSLQNGTNMTTDMSREEFAHLVARINDEVSLLRRQALTLSKAYQALLIKHREAVKKLSVQQVYPSAKCSSHENEDKGLECSKLCSCPSPKPAAPESNVVGNKYYYFNYVQYPKYSSSQTQNHHQSYPEESELTPSRPNLVDLIDQNGRPAWYSQTPQRPKVKPLVSSSSLDKKIATLEKLEERLEDKTETWKQAFFHKHRLQKVDKLYTAAEVQMMFDHWLKHREQW